MNIISLINETNFYSYHAEKRRKERGFKPEEIEDIIISPEWTKKRYDNKKEVRKMIKNREVIIVYEEKETYLRIVTII